MIWQEGFERLKQPGSEATHCDRCFWFCQKYLQRHQSGWMLLTGQQWHQQLKISIYCWGLWSVPLLCVFSALTLQGRGCMWSCAHKMPTPYQ
ncbi:hypothetical protein H681_19655 [Pseudomonas sp. ATCC 13867]|nr:hypothetical protein H681_19655 [Pseudomonas sp. ATCC 13867]RFQ16532.1 hypothetical protein D0N87_26640 [Pseudomonas sp. ATCC 13867]